MLNVRQSSAGKIVNYGHLMAARNECVGQMAPYETCPSGDENAHAVPRSLLGDGLAPAHKVDAGANDGHA